MQNLESVAQKMADLWVLMYFFVLLYFCNLFGLSIRTSMQNFRLLAQKLSELWSILCFYIFYVFWLRAVKIYLLAKFWGSSSKIGRVMLNFIFSSNPGRAHPDGISHPVTNLSVEIGASLVILQKMENSQIPKEEIESFPLGMGHNCSWAKKTLFSRNKS